MTTRTLPLWHERFKDSDSALETFIYANEPSSAAQTIQFRRELLAMLNEVSVYTWVDHIDGYSAAGEGEK